MIQIPDSWRSVRLGHILTRSKDTVLPKDLTGSSVGLVGLEDIFGGGSGEVRVVSTSPSDIHSLKTRFRAGDILYGKLRPYLNKVAIAPEPGVCSTEIWVLRPTSICLPQYASFFLRSSAFVNRVASLTKGANLPRLDSNSFDSVEIPLPPLSEQQRIVDILQEAEEIRRLRAQAGAKTAQIIPALFFSHFGENADSEFILLDSIADVVSGVALGRKHRGITKETSYIRVANVQAGFLDLTEVKETPATSEEVEKFGLASGDILLTEGGDYDKLGRGCLWDGQVTPCIHQNHVFRVRPDRDNIHPVFFHHYLQSARVKSYFLRCAKRTTNLASINLSQLKSLPVPIIPLGDQELFVREVELAESLITEAAAPIESRLSAFPHNQRFLWQDHSRLARSASANPRHRIPKARRRLERGGSDFADPHS